MQQKTAIESLGACQARRWVHRMSVIVATTALIAGVASGCGPSQCPIYAQSVPATTLGDAAALASSTTSDGSRGGWVVLHRETFDSPIPKRIWLPDTRPHGDPYDDNGAYFVSRGISAPAAFRALATFGSDGWLTLDSYSRSQSDSARLAQTVSDPAGGPNRVLRVTSPEHTDATIVRPTEPLPSRYRISLSVGFPNFGDGKPGLNGYDGGERAEPWLDRAATEQNGFYWLTILDTVPGPHNNVWIHHHRKVVFDSDNHYPSWMEIFDGVRFVKSGEHPLMMFVLDGRGSGTSKNGKPFISYSAGAWQPSGTIRAVDSYLPGEWYRVSIERQGTLFTMQVQGNFAFGNHRTYRASIDAAKACIFHFNRPNESAGGCVDNSYDPAVSPNHPHWPSGASYPDYFMFGDPHENYYQGSVHYDDITLEIWNEELATDR